MSVNGMDKPLGRPLSQNPMAVGIAAAIISGVIAAGIATGVFFATSNSQQSRDLATAIQKLQGDLWSVSSKLSTDETVLANQGAREDETNRVVTQIAGDISSLRTSVAVIQSQFAQVLPPPDGNGKKR
jgi:gas vesicle protein